MKQEIITSTIINLIKKAARIGWDVIERGRLTIGWVYRKGYFYVGVIVGGVLQARHKMRPPEFGLMFADAAHWIG